MSTIPPYIRHQPSLCNGTNHYYEIRSEFTEAVDTNQLGGQSARHTPDYTLKGPVDGVPALPLVRELFMEADNMLPSRLALEAP